MKTRRGSARGLLLMLSLLLVPELAWASRTVQGRITFTDGSPAANVLVEAWDSDPGRDDESRGTSTQQMFEIYSRGSEDVSLPEGPRRR